MDIKPSDFSGLANKKASLAVSTLYDRCHKDPAGEARPDTPARIA